MCCRRPAHRRRSTTPCRWASTGRAVRARRRATPVELQVRCRRLLRDDDGMSSLTVATTPVIANRSDGRWVIREVSNRVEFLLDGRRLSDFLEETELGRLDHQVTPFEFPAPDAQAVLSGRTPFDPSLHDASRVPLLVCPCGDLLCGALTVRLGEDAGATRWSDWAWEDQYAPALPLASLPVIRFDPAMYEQALRDAAAVSAANREPVTRMRVRVPGPWWRNALRAPQERTDEAAMLGWLRAEAVTPSPSEADSDYVDFLVSLDTAQALLDGASSSRRALDGDHRLAAVEALRAVEASEHRISLPPETLAAVRWFLPRLQNQRDPPESAQPECGMC